MKNAGLAPSLSCYNAVLHTCSFDGSARESLRLVSQMKADNVQPNMDTYFWTYQSALKANDTHGMQMV
jgi:pentatricopeptide repeat protein